MKKTVRWILSAAAAACVVLAVCFMTGILPCREDREKNEVYNSEVINVLRERFPEYFDLSTFKGLEVYVWQMAQESYSWGLMSGTDRVKKGTELWNLKGASTDEMRAILSTYDIPEEDISVIPITQVYSSYFDPNIQTPSYAAKVRKMLFSDEPIEIDLTDELFTIIMSSPQTSSNSWDYLNAHESAHKKLLADKENTLRYIFNHFLAAEQNMYWGDGLPGVLMRTILDELAPESMLDLAGTPSEYFSEWKAMARQQKEALGEKRLQKEYPAAYLLLEMLKEIR